MLYMTLVQNHLQPLNGNNMKKTFKVLSAALIINLSLLGLSHQSAFASKPFQVAFLMPFNTKSVSYDTLGNVIGKLSPSSQMAIQYYRGAMMALDSLNNAGHNIISFFYDTQSDTSVVYDILFNKTEMLSMDLIIGPFYIDELKIANRFSERFKIPVVSPYSASTSFIKNNPYYILSKPSLNTHCKALYDFVEKKYNPSRVIFLYSETTQDNNYATMFENAQKLSLLRPTLYKFTDSTKFTWDYVDLYLMPEIANIVIIPSTNETFISKMTSRLDSLSSQYNIVLVGMPQWRESQTLKVSQLSKLNCFISHYSSLNKKSDYFKLIATRYSALYGSSLSDYSVDGYNDAFYFTNSLLKKTYNISYSFEEDELISKTARIKPRYKSSQTGQNDLADYYENVFVKILQYRNGRLEDVP